MSPADSVTVVTPSTVVSVYWDTGPLTATVNWTFSPSAAVASLMDTTALSSSVMVTTAGMLI